jgi:hypothetical protein
MLNGLLEELGFFCSERRSAASLVSALVEAKVVPRMAEGVTTDAFAQRVPLELVEPAALVFRVVFCVRSTIRQLVVLVSLLGIRIRANLSYTKCTSCWSTQYVEHSIHSTTNTLPPTLLTQSSMCSPSLYRCVDVSAQTGTISNSDSTTDLIMLLL